MRRIKYKVWDKNKKKFIPEEVCALISQSEGGAFGIMIKDWEDYKEGEYFYDNAQEVVFFTGLNDKNGKEIYEGDILKCHEYDSSDTGHTILQTFNNAVVGFSYGNYYYYPKGNMKQPHQLLMYAFQREIIGNIYENPELLNTELQSK